MKFGLFGGSFDPVHHAHVALARAARRELGLQTIFIVPAARSPQKAGRPLAPAVRRLAMLRMAFRPYPFCRVSPWELRRGGVSYTVRALRAFRRRFPSAEWYLILGGDALKGFTSWRRWREILGLSRLAVGLRPGVSLRGLPRELRGRAVVLKSRLPDVSATGIRRDLRAGRRPRGLPAPVLRYIQKAGLYRP